MMARMGVVLQGGPLVQVLIGTLAVGFGAGLAAGYYWCQARAAARQRR